VEKTGRSDADSQELVTRSPCGKPGKSLRERVDTCLRASPHTFRGRWEPRAGAAWCRSRPALSG